MKDIRGNEKDKSNEDFLGSSLPKSLGYTSDIWANCPEGCRSW